MPTETKTKQRILASRVQRRVQLVVRSVWIVWQALVALIWFWGLSELGLGPLLYPGSNGRDSLNFLPQ